MGKPFCFNNIQTLFLIFMLFFLLHIIYFIIFPCEAFAMDPYMIYGEDMTSDEDIISDEDVRANLYISGKENYTTYGGINTYNTKEDMFESLYPNGVVVDYNIINDSYDNERYFDIPLTMICGESKDIELSTGTYSGCISRNIDGLLIWPERQAFHTEFIKDYTQVLTKNSSITSVSLGGKIMDRFVFVYIKCQDINKHKYHWIIWERSSMVKYWSYKAFKKRWDHETNVWSNIDDNIRKDIVIEVKDLLGLKNVDESLRKSIRTEVVELIGKIKPFSSS